MKRRIVSLKSIASYPNRSIMNNEMTPTNEQQAIVDAIANATDNIMISAYAGCAKTTTLQLAAKKVRVNALVVAFNKKIKEDFKDRFPPNFRIATFNGLGHAAFARSLGKFPKIDTKKLYKISDNPDIRRLVELAMIAGLVPNEFPTKGPTPDTFKEWERFCQEEDIELSLIPLARKALITSIEMCFLNEACTPIISFDEQVYVSTLLSGIYTPYDVIMVDEAQDLSTLNHLQIKKSLSLNSRLIVVGDPNQAIYSFRGAHRNSMAKIRSLRKNWIDLPLTITFRCPKSIVERQRAHAPHYTAASSAPIGEVKNFQEMPWYWSYFEGYGTKAILCRNNAPLIKIAFMLLQKDIGCYMLGRDIGIGLKALSKKLFSSDSVPTKTCKEVVQQHLLNPKDENSRDKLECLLAILESDNISSSKGLRQKLNLLFGKESGQVVLSTGHRAKGLEWDRVLHLDPWRIPSKFAITLEEQEQEKNLRYVIETRTKNTLALANLKDFQY